MDITLLQRRLFYVSGRYVTVLGLIAFAGFFAAGLIIARFLQSQIVRRFFSRFKIDTNFIAIVTTILHMRSGTLKVENVTKRESTNASEARL